jgi:hypothetical protein
MKAIKTLFTGMMVAAVAVMLPIVAHPAYAEIGHIEALAPAESAEIETGAGEAFFVAFEPSVRSNDTDRIEALLPAESYMAEEMGAGETAWVLMTPSVRGNDTGRIEALLPAESVE